MGAHHTKRKSVKHKNEDEVQAIVENLKHVYMDKISQSMHTKHINTENVCNIENNYVYDSDSLNNHVDNLELTDINLNFDTRTRNYNCEYTTNRTDVAQENFTDLPYGIAYTSDPAKISQHPEVTKLQNRQKKRSNSSCSTQTGDSIRRRNETTVRTKCGKSFNESDLLLLSANISQSNSDSKKCVIDENDRQFCLTHKNNVKLCETGKNMQYFIGENDNTGDVIPVRVLTEKESRAIRKIRLVDETYKDVPSEIAYQPKKISLEYFTSQKSPIVYLLFPLILPLLIIAVILRTVSPVVCKKKRHSRRR